MKTTAGIMPSLRSIAWANESQARCKACLSATLRCGWAAGHKVSVLQVQAWQVLFQDQRLLGSDTDHRTAPA